MNGPSPASFSFVFSNSQYNLYNKLMWKTIYSASNWTHNLLNMSLLPLPLSQGSAMFVLSFNYTLVGYCNSIKAIVIRQFNYIKSCYTYDKQFMVMTSYYSPGGFGCSSQPTELRHPTSWHFMLWYDSSTMTVITWQSELSIIPTYLIRHRN